MAGRVTTLACGVEAPAAGSMKLVLRTVQPRRPVDEHPLPGAHAPTLDAQALLALCGVLSQATMPGDQSPLYGTAEAYRGETRLALASFCRVVYEADWSVEGNVAIAGHKPAPVVFDPSAAGRVIDAATRKDSETTEEQVTGIVDGWSWSRGTMDFIPGTGRPFTAAVGSELRQAVADPTASQHHARATLNVTKSYPHGDRRSALHSRVLQSIEEGSPPPSRTSCQPSQPRRSCTPTLAWANGPRGMLSECAGDTTSTIQLRGAEACRDLVGGDPDKEAPYPG